MKYLARNRIAWWMAPLVCFAGCAEVPRTGNVAPQSDSQVKKGPTHLDRQFDPRFALNGPLPAHVNVPHVHAAEVHKSVKPDTLVLGVEVDGQLRAYPINMMHGPSREIVNDQLGGRSIAATW